MAINYCKPLIPNLSEVDKILKDSIESGRLSNFGPTYDLFVKELSQFLGLSQEHSVVITSSGHTALMAAYNVLGVRRLVIPAYTFESTRAAASLQGLTTIPVDVDPKSGCITPELLDKLPIASFDAVCVVCALSTIPDLTALSSWCRNNGKKLIIDGAATFGTKDIYTFADAFCLSFHATKTLSVGEAGAVVLRREDEILAREYINFGFDHNKNVVRAGINAKVSEYTCAIAVDLIRNCRDEITARLKNYEIYKASLADLIPVSCHQDTVYQALPLFLPSPDKASEVRRKLSELNIQSLQYYRPLIDLPITSDLYARNVSVPVHSGVQESDLEVIIKVVKE